MAAFSKSTASVFCDWPLWRRKRTQLDSEYLFQKHLAHYEDRLCGGRAIRNLQGGESPSRQAGLANDTADAVARRDLQRADCPGTDLRSDESFGNRHRARRERI